VKNYSAAHMELSQHWNSLPSSFGFVFQRTTTLQWGSRKSSLAAGKAGIFREITTHQEIIQPDHVQTCRWVSLTQ